MYIHSRIADFGLVTPLTYVMWTAERMMKQLIEQWIKIMQFWELSLYISFITGNLQSLINSLFWLIMDLLSEKSSSLFKFCDSRISSFDLI